MDGLSLDIPDGLREAPELEAGSVCLVAQAEPWPWPRAFRPNLTVEVTPLAPDRCTVPQLSALTIATQVTLGAHVAACDIWRGPGDADGRRLMSLYPAMDTTVIQLQYVSILGDRAVIVSVQHGADNHDRGEAVFRQAVGSISYEFDGTPPQPDPATMPRLDPFARERGLELESLAGVRGSQPFRSAGPPVDDAQLDALRRGKLRRGVDTTALQAGGLVTDRGRLTDAGEAARKALSSPARELTVDVIGDDDPRVAVLHAYQRRDTTAVVASAPPGESGADHTIDVIASQTTPIALARWLGLAPAWTFAIDDDSPTLRLDTAIVDTRLTARDTPPPAGASPALIRMWAQPWRAARLRSSQPSAQDATVITTPEAGSFRLERNRSSGEASLTPLPSAQYLRLLLRLAGFDVAAA